MHPDKKTKFQEYYLDIGMHIIISRIQNVHAIAPSNFPSLCYSGKSLDFFPNGLPIPPIHSPKYIGHWTLELLNIAGQKLRN